MGQEMASFKSANTEVCKLCSANAELQLSHVFPRFAVKYLKNTSATGFLKNFTSGKRMQEAQRVHLLCERCEQLLAKDEKAFCEKLFLPLHKQNQSAFQYNEWLIRFLVGLHWKILVTKDEHDTYPIDAKTAYAAAEGEWRAFLLGHRADHGSSEFHLFFTDVLEDSSSVVSEKLNWYIVRALDGTPTFSKSGQFGSYVKLLRVMSYAFITPRNPQTDNWIGTQVGKQGTIAPPQSIDSHGFGPLIESRVQALESAPSSMTERQLEKFKENAIRDPGKFLNSESTRVFIANLKLQRRMAAKRYRPVSMKGRDRNQSCPCGSGKKLKKCCG